MCVCHSQAEYESVAKSMSMIVACTPTYALHVCHREVESEALAKSLMKSGMKRMNAIQFKQALCMELLRCESILKDTLPSIIKV